MGTENHAERHERSPVCFDLPLDRCQSVRIVCQPHGIQIDRGLSPKTFHRNLDEPSTHYVPHNPEKPASSQQCLSAAKTSLGGRPDQLPALILMVLASACSALGMVSRSTPFARLASILSASKSPDSVKSHSKSPTWYSW